MARNYRSDTTFLKHILGNGQARGFCGGGNRFFLGGGAADCKLLSSALVELLSSASLPCATSASLGCCFHFSFSSALKKLRLRLLRQKRCLLRRTETSLTYCLQKDISTEPTALYAYTVSGLFDFVNRFQIKIKWFLRRGGYTMRRSNFFPSTFAAFVSVASATAYTQSYSDNYVTAAADTAAGGWNHTGILTWKNNRWENA